MSVRSAAIIIIYLSDYRQLSTDIKNLAEGPKARANKTGINFRFLFNIRGKVSVIRCYT